MGLLTKQSHITGGQLALIVKALTLMLLIVNLYARKVALVHCTISFRVENSKAFEYLAYGVMVAINTLPPAVMSREREIEQQVGLH